MTITEMPPPAVERSAPVGRPPRPQCPSCGEIVYVTCVQVTRAYLRAGCPSRVLVCRTCGEMHGYSAWEYPL